MSEKEGISKKIEKKEETVINYGDIKEELAMGGILDKFYSNESLERRVQCSCDLPPEMEKIFLRSPLLRGKEQGHLIRLLERSGLERDFALAYIKYLNLSWPEDKKLSNYIKIIVNEESNDSQMFWTFAPYLYKNFLEKGESEENALRKIILWAKSGVKATVENCGETHLKGLKFLNNYDPNKYILSQDQNHVSHKFTEQEANCIVDLLLEEDKKNEA